MKLLEVHKYTGITNKVNMAGKIIHTREKGC